MKAEIGSENTQEGQVEAEVKGKAKKVAGKRIGYNYIIIKSFKESKKNDVVKCLYIKSLTKFGFCVIKEGTYGDTRDKHGRDIKDRLVWQKKLHEQLQDKVRIPKLLGSFEENGNYYLVIEYIKGKTLGRLIRKHSRLLREGLLYGGKLAAEFLDYTLQIIGLLEILHQQAVVHRDATATNFLITPGKKVALIDMELSYSLNEEPLTPPFELGTYGYMSPQQETSLTPTTHEDIFSVGAILFQVWTGISPNKITNSSWEELENKVRFFIPDQRVASIVLQCLHPEAANRPALAEVKQVLLQYKNDLIKKASRPQSKSEHFSNDDTLDILQRAIGTLASPLFADPKKGWFAENNKKVNDADGKKIDKSWYGSFNLGAAGVIYLLSKMKFIGLDVNPALPYVQMGLDLIQKKYIINRSSDLPGLHFGGAGIAASLAIAMDYGLVEADPEYYSWANMLLDKENNALGVMHGIAGQGISNLICASSPDILKVNDRLNQYVQLFLEKQEPDGSWRRSSSSKKNLVTRGFAHGMAGIVSFLLEFAEHYDDNHALKSAQKGLQWLMKAAVHDHEVIFWRSSKGKDILPWWCEGSPGIVLPFLKAWSLTHDPIYKQYATGALKNHAAQVVDNNLSQCHGLSGLGEIYLEAFTVLQEQEWLDRASWIAQVILHLRKYDPKHGPYWLVEHERQPVASFMTGNAGILHFLLRYSNLDKINFPLTPGRKEEVHLISNHELAMLKVV